MRRMIFTQANGMRMRTFDDVLNVDDGVRSHTTTPHFRSIPIYFTSCFGLNCVW